MDELQAFIDEQKALDQEFAEPFDEGYEQFKIGVLLRQARESVGLTLDDIAGKMKIKKFTVSRIEESLTGCTAVDVDALYRSSWKKAEPFDSVSVSGTLFSRTVVMVKSFSDYKKIFSI
jgi:HTH-type transcriptional regulator / antitoxin HipB